MTAEGGRKLQVGVRIVVRPLGAVGRLSLQPVGRLPCSMTISIRVKAGSRENRLSFKDNTILVRVKAPALEGKANEELVRYLASVLGIAKSRIEIVSGQSSPFKRLTLPDELADKLKLLAVNAGSD